MLKELIVSSIQFMCLSEALYHEARGEGYHEMVKVGVVIHNRTLDPRWPDDICGVIEQPYQFSYRNGKTGRLPTPNKEAYRHAQEAALAVYTLDNRPYLRNILYFHTPESSPDWDYAKIDHVGALDSAHLYYRDNR